MSDFPVRLHIHDRIIIAFVIGRQSEHASLVTILASRLLRTGRFKICLSLRSQLSLERHILISFNFGEEYGITDLLLCTENSDRRRLCFLRSGFDVGFHALTAQIIGTRRHDEH